MNYREALAWLYGQQLHGIKLGLENMQQLCEQLSIDLGGSATRDALAPPERPHFIHVAGTNGKGSVCSMLASIYQAAGFRTGLYTSPHLVTFRERIQLDGKMISEAEVADGLSRIREIVGAWETSPTFFELVTALALDWFQESRAHIVILETGLGGRLDATNVVTPIASVLTPIDLDHQKYLGETLKEIAGEKCGIIKRGVPVISAPQMPEVREVICARAAACGAELVETREPIPPEIPVALPGIHQRMNAAVAMDVVDVVEDLVPFLQVSTDALGKGLASVTWPGRFQRVGEKIVLDGAHNPAAARTLAHSWGGVFRAEKATIVFGAMRDKDVRGVLEALEPIAAEFFTVRVNNDRSYTADALAAEIRECLPETPAYPIENLPEALRRANEQGTRTLIAGSLFLVGEALVELGLATASDERSEQ